jgi:vacuolar-type H+-ATPase subunit H
MRSVIDEIAAAERQADEIRSSAAASARELTLKAREEAQQAISELEKSERDLAQTRMESARAKGEHASSELLARLEQEADELCRRADGRLDKAVAYLVDRVTKPA